MPDIILKEKNKGTEGKEIPLLHDFKFELRWKHSGRGRVCPPLPWMAAFSSFLIRNKPVVVLPTLLVGGS
jgi:hypothetical protein